jgi:hypothetical protein
MRVIQFRHRQWIIVVDYLSPIKNVGNVDGSERIVSLTVLQSESKKALKLAAVLLLNLIEKS